MAACLQIRVRKSTVNNLKSTRGFTLLELIIVFTVIAILSTFGIASFVSYSRNQALVQAGSNLENAINSARGNAMSQVKPAVCSGQVLDGYQVDINTLNNTYTLSVVCLGVHSIQSVKLPTDVTFNSQTTTGTIFYPVISSGATGGNTKIVLGAYGKTFTINLDNNGNIR